MKDNRIYRPEQMTKEEAAGMADAIEKYFAKEDAKAADRQKRQAEKTAAKIASGQYIKVDGVLYDRRFYKG